MKRILAGPRAVGEALRAAPGSIETVYIAQTMRPIAARRIEDQARNGRVPCEPLSNSALDRLARGINHQGVLAITGAYPYRDLTQIIDAGKAEENPLIVVLDQVQDPRNLGAIMRSVYAFGATGLIIARNKSAKVTAAAVRSSAGASELLKVAQVTNLVRTLDQLKDEGYHVFGATGAVNTDLSRLNWRGRAVLVLGNEGRGLRRLTAEHCDTLFAIRMAAEFDSLNVSAAAAIVLHAAAQQRHFK